jgi:hypothetical protein
MLPRQLSPLLLVCLCSCALLLYVRNIDRDVLLSNAPISSTTASPTHSAAASVAAADFADSAAAVSVKPHPEAAVTAGSLGASALSQQAAGLPPAPNPAAAAAAAAAAPSAPDPNAAADAAREVKSSLPPTRLPPRHSPLTLP